MNENIDFKKYAKPQYIIIFAIAIVGGLIMASKLRPKSSAPKATADAALPPADKPYAVTDSSLQSRIDDLQRALTDLKAGTPNTPDPRVDTHLGGGDGGKFWHPPQEAAHAPPAPAGLHVTAKTTNSVSLAWQPVAGADTYEVVTDYTFLSGTTRETVYTVSGFRPGTGHTFFVRAKAGSAASGASNKVQATTDASAIVPPGGTHETYPGLPANFEMNCASVQNRDGIGSFDTVLAHERSKGQGDVFAGRNMAAIALYGIPTPWITRGNWNDHSAINQRRVVNGLFPLTEAEIIGMLTDVGTLDSAHFHEGIDTINAVRPLFERWNAPYQCGVRNVRR